MKTKEELNELKQNCIELGNKLKELTDDELKLVIGGVDLDIPINEKGAFASAFGLTCEFKFNAEVSEGGHIGFR